MPIRIETGQTPQGRPCVLLYSSGVVTLADAEMLITRTGPGTEHFGKRVLTFVANGTEYTPDARKRLPTLKHSYLAHAVVVHSAIVRAAINLMMRFAGQFGALRMFRDEAEAFAWLDSVE